MPVVPFASHSGFYFPPPAKGWRSALSLQNGKRFACFSSYSFRILIFYTEEKMPHATVIPRL